MIHSNNNELNASLLVALNARNRVIANNIANVDTPYYKAQSVEFAEQLKRKLESAANVSGQLTLKRTDVRHLPIPSVSDQIPFKVVEDQNTVMNNNQNNVDIDKEMSGLAENQLLYNYTVDRVSSYYSKMRNLLSELK